jgi:hypothetical protein
MLDNQLGLIADGTYIYSQKTLNNKIQRLLYSDQKGRPLIEPLIIVQVMDT